MPQTTESKILIVVILGTFMVMLDQTIMNIALPHIMTVFNETADRAQLVISAYMMASAIVTPAAPFICNRFGIKKVFILSQVAFLTGSFLCGIAWNTNMLILFRVIQGLAGGLLSPIAMTMLFMNVPTENRGTAMGMFGIPMMLAPALGPTLGGYLVTYWSWRMCFYVNVPVMLIAIPIGMMWLNESTIKEDTFDFKGFMLAAVGFSSILYAFSYAPTWNWDDWRIITLLVVGTVCIMTWIVVELREKQPMLDLHVFKNAGFSLATGINFVSTIGLFTTMYLVPMFLQNLRGLSAMQTGLLMIPGILGSTITMPISGKLYDKIGPRFPVVIGLTVTIAGTLWMQGMDITTSNTDLMLMLFIRGLGMGLCMMPIMTYGMASVSANMTAQASSITNVSRSVFSSLGTAVFATLLSHFQKSNMSVISQTLTSDAPGVMHFMSSVQAMMMQAGQTLEAARQTGTLVLYQYATQRATVTAYQMDYFISAIVLIMGVLPALFLPTGKIKNTNGPVIVDL